jgi:glutamate formiminotransferase / formiminotetrahydrofolate cyclodeaminase
VTRFECVPNFSEGRDAAKVEAIVAPARAVAGVHVLDVELNGDHNRAVVSLVGDEAPLLEATFQMIRVAIATIDLNHHTGEHPRMGAVDVVPFIPLGTATMADAVHASEKLAERVWRELGLPVYLYAAAARRPERSDLAVVRKGQFEGIRDSIAADPARRPDFGEARVHPTAGIVAIGARPVLIAYNAYLSTADVDIAKRVAKAIRARDGGLAEVKALGFDIQERHRAQVSMNLTDYRRTPVHRALEAVRREAARYGVTVEESEVVGLIPEDALYDAAEFYLQLNKFDRAQILERKIGGGGASAPAAPSRLVDASVRGFTDLLAARTPTPGGGSAAAAAAAMGAALGQMVLAYSTPADGSDPEMTETARALETDRRTLLEAIDEDAESFEAVRAARRHRKEHPDDVAVRETWERALRRSAEVPLATARRARAVAERLERVRPKIKPTIASDLTTALALLRAGVDGALANVAINLEDLAKANLPRDDLAAELARLRASAP